MIAASNKYGAEVSALFEGLDEKVSRSDCAELIASGISLDVARRRGYATFEQASALCIGYGFADYQARVPGLLLPRHDVFGKQSGAMFKPTSPRMIGAKKKIKYETVAGSRLMLDVPPTCQPDLGKPAVDLWITEGIKKGDALASQGRCAIDLSGVWGWLGTNPDGGKTAIPDWRDVALNGRKVFIAFDSDAASNPDVARAEKELADYLGAKGGKVTTIRIPPAEDGSKQGIDDFLVAGGDLDALVLSAPAADGAPDAKATIARLAALGPLEYEQVRSAEAERLSIRVRFLDIEVSKQQEKIAEAAIAPETTLWGEEVDGAELLEEIVAVYKKYVALPKSQSYDAIALWVVHTHAFEAASFAPRLAHTSPEMRCGKTNALQLHSVTTSRALAASNFSAAVIYRAIDAFHPTVIADEIDTFLPENAELRGILNSGHSPRLAFVLRCQGDEFEPTKFSTWAPMAVGLIGKLPRTLRDRSIEIPHRRKLKTEQTSRLREKELIAVGAAIAPKCARWAKDNLVQLKEIEPVPPEELNDRAADSWDPLLAIADRIGGKWPERARRAALVLSGDSDDDVTLGVLLLGDLRAVFAEAPQMTTANIIKALVEMDERPWGAFGKHPKPLSPRQLSNLLRPFGVIPSTIRLSEESTAKGYTLKGSLQDAFDRYLPCTSPPPPDLSVATSQLNGENGKGNFSSVTRKNVVTDEKVDSSHAPNGCDVATVKKGGNGHTYIVDVDEEEPA